LEQARQNAIAHFVADQLEMRQGSWFVPLSPLDKFDLIVSNPPYIETKIVDELSPDVRLFDPMVALDGGTDGLDAYREISALAPQFLTQDGTILVEIGFDQALLVTGLFEAAGFASVGVLKDMAGLDRVVSASLSS
jgi:release factor glutamine methyltransferase